MPHCSSTVLQTHVMWKTFEYSMSYFFQLWTSFSIQYLREEKGIAHIYGVKMAPYKDATLDDFG